MLESVPNVAFVVDTEEYSGNFERPLCAYITGMTGDCGVGEEEAAEFSKDNEGENPFEDIIMNVPDDHGCSRPVSIWETPGWFNDGHGGHFRDGSLNGDETRYPAFQSVAVFFTEKPTEDMLALMKKRAGEFCLRKKLTLTGFRILEFKLEIKAQAV